jgi:hypothetical protein
MLAIDQRVFYRLPIELAVRFTTRTGDEAGTPRTGTTVNLSAGGLLLRCRLPDEATLDGLLRGTVKLEVVLDLPTFGPLHALARAVWVERSDDRDGRIGVRFVDLPAAQREQVHATVCLLNATSTPAGSSG